MSRYRLFQVSANGQLSELALTIAHLSVARDMAATLAKAGFTIDLTTLDRVTLERFSA